ncbi:MAG: hypothetical protein ACTSO7_15780 [Candidatus Heimdallarchaeota archaeon]
MSITDEGKRLSKKEVAKIKEGFSNFLKGIVSFIFTAVGVGLGILIVYTTGLTDANAFAGIVCGCGFGMSLLSYGIMELISRARIKGGIRKTVDKNFPKENLPMVIEENKLLKNIPISEDLDEFEPLVYDPISDVKEKKEQLIKTFPELIRHVKKGTEIKLDDIENKLSIKKEIIIEAILDLLKNGEISATLDILDEIVIIN